MMKADDMFLRVVFVRTFYAFLIAFLYFLFNAGIQLEVTAQKSTTTATTTTSCQEYKDVVFMLDSSLSICESSPRSSVTCDNWALMLAFVSDVIYQFPKNFRVAVISFSTQVSAQQVDLFSPATDLASIRSKVNALQFIGGNTNISGALRVARSLIAEASSGLSGAPTDPSFVGILLTDGLSNVDAAYVSQEARLAKQEGVTLMTIGITPYVDTDELMEIASDPVSDYYIQADNFTQLNDSNLVDKITDVLVCYTPHTIGTCQDTKADIAFIIDSSGSIGITRTRPDNTTYIDYANWDLLLGFVSQIVDSLNVGWDQTRVAVVRFSWVADVEIWLNEYNSSAAIVSALNNISFVGSTTNTSGALLVARTQVFTPEHGDRPDVQNIAIIITDGQSDNSTATIEQANLTKAAGVQIFVIGLTDQINPPELMAMASVPTSEYYYNRTTFALVQTVKSQLVWSVCNRPCDSDGSCIENVTSGCPAGKSITWTLYKGYLLLGHRDAILTDIDSPAVCQTLCLQNPQCMSIQYVPSMHQCIISYFTQQAVPSAFRPDPDVDYYQWTCA